jgi:hypothetical protein
VGVRLLILGWWTPNYIIRRELTNVSEQTITALRTILSQYAPQEVAVYTKQQTSGSIKDQRANMAKTHRELVERLEATLGREEAVKLGREALFMVGQNLGKQTRIKLGVSDTPKDLITAAKILYRVLGIDFHLEWLDNSKATAIIDRCALAQEYSNLTCKVLSATDEGLINGLQPSVIMKFEEFMTNGCKNCRANIQFNKKEKEA